MMGLQIIDVREIPADSAFLIDDGKTALLCDTGFGFTGFAVAENVKKHLGTRSLDGILLTHSHYDHALGAPCVKRVFPDAKIVASEYAAKIFSKPNARALMKELDGKFARKCGVFEYECLADELFADIVVSDKSKLCFNTLSFEVLSFPGHTRCSVGFYFEDHKFLVACETLGLFDGKDKIMPSYLVGYDMTLSSLRKAKELDADKILSPHYGLLDEKTAKTFFERSELSAIQTASEIKNFLRRGRDKTEILEFFKDKFYHGYVKEVYPLDAMELNTSITIDLIQRELLGN